MAKRATTAKIRKQANDTLENRTNNTGSIHTPKAITSFLNFITPGGITQPYSQTAATSKTIPAKQPAHLPRWAYLPLTLAGAAALYISAEAANLVPTVTELLMRDQQKPAPTAPSVTPALSQYQIYQKQALEQIAIIGQKEPGLAAMLTEQVTAMNENRLASLISVEGFDPIKKVIGEGNYSIDTLVDGADTTFIVARSKDEYRRNSLLPIFKAAILTIEQFLGVNYTRPLLMIDLDNAKSLGGGEQISIQANDWTLRDKTHETGHVVWEVYPIDLVIKTLANSIETPNWLAEGVAEFAGIHAASKLPETYPELLSKMNSPEWKGKDKTIPDFEQWYTVSRTIVDRPDFNPSEGAMTKGFVFLYEFRQLVGQEAFAEAMGHLYDAKVVKAELIRKNNLRGDNPTWTLTDKDIESILEQHIPPDKKPQFTQLYKARIYDVKTAE